MKDGIPLQSSNLLCTNLPLESGDVNSAIKYNLIAEYFNGYILMK